MQRPVSVKSQHGVSSIEVLDRRPPFGGPTSFMDATNALSTPPAVLPAIRPQSIEREPPLQADWDDVTFSY